MVSGINIGKWRDGFERYDMADLREILDRTYGDNHILLDSVCRPVPIINNVAAGYPLEFTDLDYPPSIADEYIFCPGASDPQAFATRIVGDSMEADYFENDVVVFSPNTHPDEGNDCFVRFAGGEGTTFKRFFMDDDETIRLQPINKTYPAQTYPCDEITGLWPAIYRVQTIRNGK